MCSHGQHQKKINKNCSNFAYGATLSDQSAGKRDICGVCLWESQRFRFCKKTEIDVKIDSGRFCAGKFFLFLTNGFFPVNLCKALINRVSIPSTKTTSVERDWDGILNSLQMITEDSRKSASRHSRTPEAVNPIILEEQTETTWREF